MHGRRLIHCALAACKLGMTSTWFVAAACSPVLVCRHPALATRVSHHWRADRRSARYASRVGVVFEIAACHSAAELLKCAQTAQRANFSLPMYRGLLACLAKANNSVCVGCADFKQQNELLGPPLQLSLEEVTFLHRSGTLPHAKCVCACNACNHGTDGQLPVVGTLVGRKLVM
jgi:hypothetical protein